MEAAKARLRGLTRLRQKQILIHWLGVALRTFFLVSVSYIILYPLFYMISNSIKPLSQLADPSVVWVPKTPSLENFQVAMEAMDFANSFFVSLSVNVVSAFIEVFTCAVVAYGFARFEFKEKKLVFALVMLTLLVPAEMIIVPLYTNFRHLDVLGLLGLLRRTSGLDLRPNLINTPLVFYIPSMFGVGLRSGLFIFIYHQFFKKLPKELEEAAWIDGAGPLKTFLRVVIPASGVAILTVTIFSVIWNWNDYYLSAMYFHENFPLAVSLAQIDTGLAAMGYGTAMLTGFSMAACLLFILPVLVMYLFLQKFFIRSIDRVGIVG